MRTYRLFEHVHNVYRKMITRMFDRVGRRFGQFGLQLVFLTIIVVIFGLLVRFLDGRKKYKQKEILLDSDNYEPLLEEHTPINRGIMNSKLGEHQPRCHSEDAVQQQSKQAVVETLMIRLDHERSQSRSPRQSKNQLPLTANRVDLPYQAKSDHLPSSRTSDNFYR